MFCFPFPSACTQSCFQSCAGTNGAAGSALARSRRTRVRAFRCGARRGGRARARTFNCARNCQLLSAVALVIYMFSSSLGEQVFIHILFDACSSQSFLSLQSPWQTQGLPLWFYVASSSLLVGGGPGRVGPAEVSRLRLKKKIIY